MKVISKRSHVDVLGYKFRAGRDGVAALEIDDPKALKYFRSSKYFEVEKPQKKEADNA